ncbi:DNA polymerase III subunit delta [Leptospira ilyithenensis]|uniref:DNA polymerase III subunit delta n=1 Tax=Leptospira ilyithenensis TaxID=2484901 RepID=A0A4R9LRX1_9LEPT|nr:DNA polymerase III subunit delta [Leptospira ilyithenensis]TGN10986.1 DNA polymerase III subunit delta [Leptospira ilyithenensis]
METKKTGKEYTSLFQLFKTPTKEMPQIFTFVGEDSYEFELITDFYKEALNKQGETFEIIVIVAEGGDQNKLFAELFTPDMFFPKKLIIVKHGTAFFKPILDPKASTEYRDFNVGFKKNITSVSDKIFFLVHYDSKDLPASFNTLFQSQHSYYKPKILYQSDITKTLREVLEQEHVQLENDAWDEFVHKIPANIGAYLKSIRKLKQYLNKTKFTLDDINAILFNQTQINPSTLVDYLVQGRKTEFFKEFTKFTDDNGDILSFLTRLLYKLDEIRKFRIIRTKHNGEVPIPVMDELLKTGHFSEGRKNFMRKQLATESKHFTEKSLNDFYELLIEMNIKFKSGLRNEEGRIYFSQKMMDAFRILQQTSSN